MPQKYGCRESLTGGLRHSREFGGFMPQLDGLVV
jgi:hypothetical protein